MSLSAASSLEHPAAPGAAPPRAASLRRSIDAAVRHASFVTHAPFDCGMLEGPMGCQPYTEPPNANGSGAAPGGGEGEPLLMGSPLAREPARKDAAGAPTWADAAAEARRLLALSLPLVFQSMASMLLTLVSTIFVGRLNDPTALGGVVLASSVYNVTGISMVIGLSSALDTLCGQAYGARRFTLLGVYLQRAQLICWALCLPIALLWLNARSLLLAMGQEPAIVEVATRYIHILTPSLFISVLSDTCRRYLLAQRVVLPGMVASIATTVLSPVYNYTFIHRLGWRTDGAAVAVLLCNATNAALINGYRLYRDWSARARGSPESTWGGCDPRAALAGWGQYLTLGLPAAAMICLEWWVWEIMVVAAGLLPSADVAVSVMGLMMTTNSIFYMLPSSLGSATSTRVANALGSGDAPGARLVFRVAAGLTALIGSGAAAATYALRRPLVGIFTSEPATVALAMGVMPIMAMSLLGDSCVAVLGCVLRAAGRQATGATLNILGYWCVGLPLALVLAFPLHLGVLGFWVGLSAASGLQALVFLGVISRFDWPREVARSRALLHANLGHGGGSFSGGGGGGDGECEGRGPRADEEAGVAAAGAAAGGGDELTRPLLQEGPR